MALMRFLMTLAACLAAAPAFAEEPAYLFDALQARGSAYRASWDKLMKDVQPTPDWLMQFNKNYDGAAGEMVPITIDGKAYQLSYVCKPTDCSGRKFEVLFDPDGAHAFGALGGKDDAPAFYGAPPRPLQDALTKAFKG